MKLFSFLVVGLTSLSALSMNCKDQFTGTNKHNSKSAVDSLGLSALRDSRNPEVQKWVAGHNARTTVWLNTDHTGNADGLLKKIADRAAEISAKNSPPVVEIAEGTLFTKAGGLVMKKANGDEVVLVPKVVLPNNGGATVVAEFKVSPDTKYVAYAAVTNGLDVLQWSVFDLAASKTVAGPFDVRMLDFNWSADSKSIYYTKWASLNEAEQGVMYAHNYTVDISTGKSRIAFIPRQFESIEAYGVEDFINSKGQKQLVAYRTQGVAEVPNALYLGSEGKADPTKNEFQVGEFKWKALEIANTYKLGRLIGIRNGELIIRTSEVGSKFGLVKWSLETDTKSVLVPAQNQEVLLVAQAIGDKLYLQYLDTQQFHNIVKVYDLKGTLLKSFKMSDIDSSIPNTGTLTAVVGHASSENLYFTYGDVLQPNITLRLNPKTLSVTRLSSPEVNFDNSKVSYNLDYAKSKDGLKVPYKTWVRTDSKPKVIYLYYYGFIGIAQLGQYNKKFQAQLDLGGAVAIASPRGGGDYGRDYQMAPKLYRQPSMLDLVAVAKELQKKYPEVPIVASGRSFGGMMTLMLAVHYPQYFAGFSSVVPVSDVNEFLNRGLFGRFAGDDFKIPRNSKGETVDSTEWREALNTWNPLWNLKNLKAKDVKPLIIFSGANDERVGPEQGRIFVQAFLNKFPQYAGKIHYYEEPLNGHVGRTEFAQESAFIARIIGLKEDDFKPLVK